jgi:hypothetical protein
MPAAVRRKHMAKQMKAVTTGAKRFQAMNTQLAEDLANEMAGVITARTEWGKEDICAYILGFMVRKVLTGQLVIVSKAGS